MRMVSGGEGGIRTLDTVARIPHFECGAFDHSATSPQVGCAFGAMRPGSKQRAPYPPPIGLPSPLSHEFGGLDQPKPCLERAQTHILQTHGKIFVFLRPGWPHSGRAEPSTHALRDR